MSRMDNMESTLNAQSPKVLSVFRIIVGFFFTLHGTQKIFNWPSGDGAAAIGAWPIWYAGVIEVVVGILVTLGLFTRLAAFIGSGEMAFAYFTRAQPKGLLPIQNGGELSATYCFALFLLVFTGGGFYALDARRRRSSKGSYELGATR